MHNRVTLSKQTLTLRNRTTRAASLVAIGAALVSSAFVGGARGADATTTPPPNLLSNPSFERGLAPWSGTHLIRRALHSAPSGRIAAQVSTVRGRLVIDDWPGEVRSTEGATYTASMYFAAASRYSVGKQITLVLRQHDAHGAWVASWQTTAKLTRTFQRLSVTGTSPRSGDIIDVYAYETKPGSHDSFYADNASLTVGPVIEAARRLRATSSSTSSSPTATTTASPSPTSTTTTTATTALSPSPTSTSTSTTTTTTSSSPSPTSTTTSTPPTSGTFTSSVSELAIDTGQMNALGDTSRYQFVILQDYMYSKVAQIKAANPNTKVYAYMEAPVTKSTTCSTTTAPSYAPHDSFGVNYCYAIAQHPEWFLHDLSGQILKYADYAGYTMMDIGNASYQSTWASNAIAAAKADGFDGIYMDDINTYPGHGVNGQIKEYTDLAYGQAMTNFVTAVSDKLRANGIRVTANVAANPWVSAQRSYGLTMAAHLDGYDREFYSRYGDVTGPFSNRFNTSATSGTPPLDYMIQYDQAVQAAGARIMGIDYGYSSPTSDDLATMSYGRAAFLLAWDGIAGSGYMFRPGGQVDPANPLWTIDLGTPSGASVLTGAVYQRTYTGGLVYLNPSPTSSVSVSVPAGYVNAYGTSVSGTVSLAPMTALLLKTAN